MRMTQLLNVDSYPDRVQIGMLLSKVERWHFAASRLADRVRGGNRGKRAFLSTT